MCIAGSVNTHVLVEKCRLRPKELKRLRTDDVSIETTAVATPAKRLKPLDIIDCIRELERKLDVLTNTLVKAVSDGIVQGMKVRADMSTALVGGAVSTRRGKVRQQCLYTTNEITQYTEFPGAQHQEQVSH